MVGQATQARKRVSSTMINSVVECQMDPKEADFQCVDSAMTDWDW